MSSRSAIRFSRCSPAPRSTSLTCGAGEAGGAVQVDAHGLLAWRGDVEPADAGRRVGAQAEVAGRFRTPLGVEQQGVTVSPVVGHGERLDRRRPATARAQRVTGLPRGDQAGPGRRVRVRHEPELGADRLVVEQDQPPDGDVPVRPVPGRGGRGGSRPRRPPARPGDERRAAEPARTRRPDRPARARRADHARLGRFGAVPRRQGQVRIGQDGLSGLRVQRADRGQRPGGPGEGDGHHDQRGAGRRGRGQRQPRRLAQLGLGQQPQEGLRALAVHALIVRYFRGRPDRCPREDGLVRGVG